MGGWATGFLDHLGCYYLRHGKIEQARRTLEQAKQHAQVAQPRLAARAFADLADTYRMLGRRNEARHLLEEAETLQTAHRLEGELAEFTWTHRAKLEDDHRSALDWLHQALAIQITMEEVIAEARTHLLLARLARSGRVARQSKARVLELCNQRPALARCWLTSSILKNWSMWTGGTLENNKKKNMEETDPFWNL